MAESKSRDVCEAQQHGHRPNNGIGCNSNGKCITRTFNNSNRRGRDNSGLSLATQAYYHGGHYHNNKGGKQYKNYKWQQQGPSPGWDPAVPQVNQNQYEGQYGAEIQSQRYPHPYPIPSHQYQRQFYRHNHQKRYPVQSQTNMAVTLARPYRSMDYLPGFIRVMGGLQLNSESPSLRQNEDEEWGWHAMMFGGQAQGDLGHGDGAPSHDSPHGQVPDHGLFDMQRVAPFLPPGLSELLFHCLKPVMRDSNALQLLVKRTPGFYMGVDDFDSLSVTDSGVFSDNDACSSGRASPVSCKAGELGGERDRFAILTYDQVKRVDSVLNEMVALEGRGNFPALELKLKDLLTAVKDRLVQEGIKIRDIRLNGGAASYALKDRLDFCCVCGVVYTPSGEDGGMLCSCLSSEGQTKNFSYNDIDLIFGMELTTAKHFDRVKTAVLDALLDLLPPQVSRKRMSPCALKEAYVSKMVKVCEGDRWSLIALGNGPAANSSSKGRSCSVELKFVDTMRRQYEFSVDSFQIVLDSLMLFYKCATVPMSSRFYPTVVGESVFGDFYGALYHLQNGLIATRHPEEIRGGGLLKYCNLLVRGYRPADCHSIPPLQRYMCSRFFIDFPEVEQQESKLRTYLANHMSGVSARLRYAFLITLYHVVDSSTVCLMGHERRLTLNLIQRLACELFSTDCGQGIYGPQPNQMYQCYSSYYMPQCTLTNSSSSTASLTDSNHPAPSANGTTYYPTPQISSTSTPAAVSATPVQPHNYQSQRSTGPQKSCSTSSKTLRHSQQQPIQNASKASSTPPVTLLTASS